MISITNNDKVRSVLDGYFSMLSNTGYIPVKASNKFVLYIFLIEFVHNLAQYISEDDYDLIVLAMQKLFTGECCLFKYPSMFYDSFASGSLYLWRPIDDEE